ncbi:serine protease [Trichocoleus desertorum AS-A10]|uniref:trypsin-like peptidase domain-containing protein n=1 Tax=Trichocoleus desertorum TaxID=1481672 RepID=UPI003296D2FF
MNSEVFLEREATVHLTKALIPIFVRVNSASDRHALLLNAEIHSAFIANLNLNAQPNMLVQNIVAGFKRFQVSGDRPDYHPMINLLTYLTDFADSYELSAQDLIFFNQLFEQGHNNFNASRARKAVGRIESPIGTGIGTGSLVAKDLLLTCNHIFSKTRVRQAWIRFGYTIGSYGLEEPFELNLDFVRSSNQPDYALIRIKGKSGINPITPNSTELNSGQSIRLIHHPLGNPVIISGLGQIVQVGDEYINHNLNTDEGSSGAPIFNTAWQFVAIHRGHPGIGRSMPRGTMEGIPVRAIWDQIQSNLDSR